MACSSAHLVFSHALVFARLSLVSAIFSFARTNDVAGRCQDGSPFTHFSLNPERLVEDLIVVGCVALFVV
jgi:hypothetical protein